MNSEEREREKIACTLHLMVTWVLFQIKHKTLKFKVFALPELSHVCVCVSCRVYEMCKAPYRKCYGAKRTCNRRRMFAKKFFSRCFIARECMARSRKKRNSILNLIIYPQRHMQFGLPVAACLPVCVCPARTIFFPAVSWISIVFLCANFRPNNISKKVPLLRPFLCLFTLKVINVLVCNQTSMFLFIGDLLVSFSFHILYFKLYCIFKLFNTIIKRYGFVQIYLRKRGRDTYMWLFSHLFHIKGL